MADSPIDRIPVEVLAEILRAYWLDYLASRYDPAHAANEMHPTKRSALLMLACAPLLLLAQVCRAWRSIILGTASLWAEIYVSPFAWSDAGNGMEIPPIPWLRKPTDLATGLSLLRTLLDHSAQLPLHLTLANRRSSSDTTIDNDAIQILAAAAPRLATLKLLCLQSDARNLEAQCSGFPLLADLDVSLSDLERREARSQAISFTLANAPSLRRLTCPILLELAATPIEQLESLTLSWVEEHDLDYLYSILERCTGRVSLRLMNGDVTNDDFNVEIVPKTCNLTHLELETDLLRNRRGAESSLRSAKFCHCSG